MSLCVNGVSCLAVIRSMALRTAVSSVFLASLPLRSRDGEAITVNAGDESLTVVLRCSTFDPGPRDPDLVLGLDWKSGIRDLLLFMGRALPPAFDPFEFYSVPTGPFLSSDSPIVESGNVVESENVLCSPVHESTCPCTPN
ncbi:hypothetical protein MVEN_01624500 [Mycena venus]|uniref:Uncharacterized protein n=1 Tax=Mycena venus TaxID=2733690 RepID=A0A8H6XMV2_9AGAR|nr:hypothetical protein MVEN_01624500 [Mycena venus]